MLPAVFEVMKKLTSLNIWSKMNTDSTSSVASGERSFMRDKSFSATLFASALLDLCKLNSFLAYENVYLVVKAPARELFENEIRVDKTKRCFSVGIQKSVVVSLAVSHSVALLVKNKSGDYAYRV